MIEAVLDHAVERRVWQALEGVSDPEIPVLTVVDLGIVRAVRAGDPVEVVITPTYSGCPAMRTIEIEIGLALARAGFPDAKVTTVLAPAWTTDWLSEAGRRKLEAYGIAPPAETSTSRRALFGAPAAVRCPHCRSTETERVSEFGSTACKALYRCKSCLEPFDYFKCI
jgi:ring-1,2-phenylacetyl-CoA epoxidase subunit PaaD